MSVAMSYDMVVGLGPIPGGGENVGSDVVRHGHVLRAIPKEPPTAENDDSDGVARAAWDQRFRSVLKFGASFEGQGRRVPAWSLPSPGSAECPFDEQVYSFRHLAVLQYHLLSSQGSVSKNGPKPRLGKGAHHVIDELLLQEERVLVSGSSSYFAPGV